MESDFLAAGWQSDGTDFFINEPKAYSRRWYSRKFKKAGLRYEVEVSPSGQIVSTAGSFEAGIYPKSPYFAEG